MHTTESVVHPRSRRHRVTLLVAGFLVVGAGSVAAQESEPRIVVDGHGELSVEPDLAVLTVAVETAEATAHDATRENARKISDVIDAVEASYGEGGSLSTGGYSLRPRYADRRPGSSQAPEIVGYIASNRIQIEVRDLARIGTVLDAALEAGANDSSGLQFLREDRSSESAVLARAAEDAAERARVLANALGVRLVRILEVRTSSAGPPRPIYAEERMMAMAQSDVGTRIEAGDLTLRATVQVTWEIE